ETGGAWQRLAIASAEGMTGGSVSSEPEPSQAEMERVLATGEIRSVPRAHPDSAGAIRRGERFTGDSLIYAPLKVGVRPTGVLVLIASDLDRGTIEAIAGLVAIALERARFLRQVSRTEALRQSDELKSALLASVSHALRTPLTSMRAAVDNLLQHDLSQNRGTLSQDTLREFHIIISEEVGRLSRLVNNLLEMARIEAGRLALLT